MKINIENISLNKSLKTKLCILSDIHHIKSCDNKFYDSIYQVVIKQKPNYVLMPGDIIEKPALILDKSINHLIDFLKKISRLCPVIISKGNHEIKKDSLLVYDFYKIINKIDNVYVLDNKSIALDNYHFIGFSPSNFSYLKKYKKNWQENFIKEFNACHFKIDPFKTNILLCHSPQVITLKEVQDLLTDFTKINYTICGHMHNGLTPKCLDNVLKTRGIFGPEYTILPKNCRGIKKVENDQKIIICKSLRSLTKDNLIFRTLDKCFKHNITLIEI